LKAGQHRAIETTTVSTGSAHPPGANSANESALSGWDLATINTTSTQDSIAHYYFNLSTASDSYTFTASLAWNRQLNATSINNLDLFLYRTSNGSQIVLSVSTVDNIEHIYVPSLAPGRYDLQVLKHGGANTVSASETYALAFENFSFPLNLTYHSGNVVLTWPTYPAGFSLETTTNLKQPITWSPVSVTPVISNNLYRVSYNSPYAISFFRLRR
jgi:hypothetical protein